MKKIFYLLSILVFSSCSDSKIELNGEFIKVLTKNEKLNVYTFDFNKVLKISENGDNYLITDDKGNKSVATNENGVISYNNCKILVDKNENVLINTCSINNNSYSNDYWPKEKVEKYLADLSKIKFKEYIENYLSIYDTEGLYYEIPKIDDFNENEKKNMNKTIIELNPYSPFISFGDFNNDNKYPDIVVISKDNDNELHSKYADVKLSVLHAGSKKLIQVKTGKFTPILHDSPYHLENFKENKFITILNLQGGYVNYRGFSWNGRKYKEIELNM